jgi:hypothetical protein
MRVLRGLAIAFFIGVIILSSYVLVLSITGSSWMLSTNQDSKTDNLIKDGGIKIYIASSDNETRVNNG